MIPNASQQSMSVVAGAHRRPRWRLSLRWPVPWRAGPVRGRGFDLWHLSDHLRRDIGVVDARVPPEANVRRHAWFL